MDLTLQRVLCVGDGCSFVNSFTNAVFSLQYIGDTFIFEVTE